MYLASLERLLARPPTTLLPAHGPAIADGHGKLREYIAHRRMREARVARGAARRAAHRSPSSSPASTPTRRARCGRSPSDRCARTSSSSCARTRARSTRRRCAGRRDVRAIVRAVALHVRCSPRGRARSRPAAPLVGPRARARRRPTAAATCARRTRRATTRARRSGGGVRGAMLEDIAARLRESKRARAGRRGAATPGCSIVAAPVCGANGALLGVVYASGARRRRDRRGDRDDARRRLADDGRRGSRRRAARSSERDLARVTRSRRVGGRARSSASQPAVVAADDVHPSVHRDRRRRAGGARRRQAARPRSSRARRPCSSTARAAPARS